MKKILTLATLLSIPFQQYGYCHGCGGGGWGWNWAGPALFGTALTTAAIASSRDRQPQTVVIEEKAKPKRKMRISKSTKREIQRLKADMQKLIQQNEELFAINKQLQEELQSLRSK